MPYNVKYPLSFADDGTTVTTSEAKNQFQVFFRVPEFTRIVDVNYGIGEELFLQRSIYSIQEISNIYFLKIRSKFKNYIKNIYISRLNAEYERSSKTVYLNIFYIIENEEKFVKYKIASL